MSIKAYIFAHMGHLEDGHTVTLTCPNCLSAGKFTATVRGDYILYNCYRNSCHTSGKVSLDLSAEEKIKRVKNVGKAYNLDSERFKVPDYWIDGIGDDACLKYMEKTHILQAYKSGIFRPMYDPSNHRFIFPIKNENGEVEGAIGRSLIGATPKVYNYNTKFDKPFICGQHEGILLVEDCASAVAATRGGHCAGMALLGTKMRKEFIKYLSPYQWVGIALDRDAYSESLFLRKSLTSYIKDVRIRKLSKDIKDMSDEEYEKWWVDNA